MERLSIRAIAFPLGGKRVPRGNIGTSLRTQGLSRTRKTALKKKLATEVPTVVQQDCSCLWSAGTQVRSPASTMG